jgi:hypothetical protein
MLKIVSSVCRLLIRKETQSIVFSHNKVLKKVVLKVTPNN